ncbi:MAG TPA: Hsp20/alpha crystallin family protein [Steroidobacteraceae bacterium]|nr:Hsp20/alpha crystallin family protein [Steroidobacteraceae bacterium]
MSLIRWEPLGAMDDVFARMLPATLGRWPRFTLEGNGGKVVEWTPSADISETEAEYVIRAELPAVKKEDVKVTFDDGTLTIQGERKQQKEDKSEKYHRIESFYGSFARRFSLPDNVKADAIRCESKDGVLTVHVPKAEPTKSKPTQIKVE